MLTRVLVVVSVLILAGLPVIQGQGPQAPGTLVQPDKRGDVTVTAAGQVTSPPLPENDLSAYVDLTELSLTDLDEENLIIRLKVAAGFKQIFSSGGVSSVGQAVAHQVMFSVPGVGGTKVPAIVQVETWLMRIHNNSEVRTDPMVIGTRLCYPQPGQEACDFSSYGVERRLDQGALVLTVPKAVLTVAGMGGFYGRNVPATLPARLVPGDALTDIWARGVQSATPFAYNPFPGTPSARLVDRAPDAAALSLVLLHGSPAPDLRMSVSQRAVVFGEDTEVAVLVQNLAPHKRIVNLSVEVLSTWHDAPWSVSITPSVTLGAGKSTNVSLRVRPAPAGAEGLSFAELKARATILTEPGTIAVNRWFMQGAEPLDRDHSTYYVHGSNYLPFGTGLPVFGFGAGWLTRRETEPRFADAPYVMSPRGFGGGNLQITFASTVSSSPEPNRATMRPGEPIRARVEIEAPFPGAATVSVHVQHASTLVGEATKAATIQVGRNKVEFDVVPLATFTRLDPTNGTLRLEIRYTVSGADAVPYMAALFTLGSFAPKVVPKTTLIQMPLEREPNAIASNDGRRITLAPAEELESFVNPGRVQVFEFDLRNEEKSAATLAVEALNVTDGWNVEVRPGQRFRLKAGDGVRLGALVQPDESLKEGDAVKFRLVVRDVANDTLVAGQWIRAIVTRGVDIENETFEAAAEDKARVDDGGPRDTPGVGFLVAATVALVPLSRRRRR